MKEYLIERFKMAYAQATGRYYCRICGKILPVKDSVVIHLDIYHPKDYIF